LPSWRLGSVKLGAAWPEPTALPAFFPPLVNSTAATTAPTKTTTTTATTVLPDLRVRASLDVDRALHVRMDVAVVVELPRRRRRELVVLFGRPGERVLLVERVAAPRVGGDVHVVGDGVLVVEVDDDGAVGLQVQRLLLEVDVLSHEVGARAVAARR